MTTEPNTRITRMCKVLTLHRCSYYTWVNTEQTRMQRTCADAVIGAKIKTIFHDDHGLYGAKRIAAVLNEDHAGMPVNHKKVARIMHTLSLKGLSKHRRCATTTRILGHQVMPDLVGRNFTASSANQVYVGDIAYLPCKGWEEYVLSHGY